MVHNLQNQKDHFTFASSNKKNMSKQIVTQEQKLLIEKVGVYFEKSGMQPAASRILALLMISDNTELTFDEIIEALNISKSAASNSINLLLNMNKIEYVTKPGDRKRYFKNRIEHWRQDMRKSVQEQMCLADLFKEILKQRPGNTTEFNSNLQGLINFLDFLQIEIPILYEKWENKIKKA